MVCFECCFDDHGQRRADLETRPWSMIPKRESRFLGKTMLGLGLSPAKLGLWQVVKKPFWLFPHACHICQIVDRASGT